MALNIKCPRCGGVRVQLSSERSKHGFLWFLIFGVLYLVWIPIKWTIGLTILLFDWWMAIIKGIMNKGYVWKSKGFFTTTKKLYYCHDCGYNFRA